MSNRDGYANSYRSFLVLLTGLVACGGSSPTPTTTNNEFNDCSYALAGAFVATGNCGWAKGSPASNSVVINASSNGINVSVNVTPALPIFEATFTNADLGAGGGVTISQGSTSWFTSETPYQWGSWTLTITAIGTPVGDLYPLHGTFDAVACSASAGACFASNDPGNRVNLHMTF
jgi:hypothetical protein